MVEALELKVAEATESAMSEASASSLAGSQAPAQVIGDDEDLDPETEQKLVELFEAETKFNT